MTTNPTAPQDGGEKLAAEWVGKLPRDQFEMLLLLTNKAYARGRNAALEEAARVAEWAHMVPPDGGSPSEAEYEVARSAAAAIRALQQKGPFNG